MYVAKRSSRSRIYHFIKSHKTIRKNSNTITLVGCSPGILRKHLESKFKKGMSWENYSFKGWHVDHIIPISSAKNEEEFIKLCHYTNLQPLWATENMKKRNKILI